MAAFEYYYAGLDDIKQSIYREIYNSVMRYEAKIAFFHSTVDQSEYARVYLYVGLDHPEIYFVNFGKFTAKIFPIGIEIQVNYYCSIEEIPGYTNRVVANTAPIVKSILNSSMSDYDKVKNIFDYLVSNADYNQDALGAESGSTIDFHSHSIIGVFLKGTAVCDGIAKAFQFLANKIGLNAITIHGTSNVATKNELHAWNAVCINNQWCQVDVTWDIQDFPNIDYPLYMYFNVSDDEMREDHVWDEKIVPRCMDTAFDYYERNDLIIDRPNKLFNLLRETVAQREDHSFFKSSMTAEAINDVIREFKKAILFTIGIKLTTLPRKKIFIIQILY